MKIQFLEQLSLRKRITLIALLGMMLIAITMAITEQFTSRDAESRFNEALLETQGMLWQQLISDEFKRSALGMNRLSRERFIGAALAKGEYSKIQERADILYNRLLSADILQHMQITNNDGEVIYRTDGIDSTEKSQMKVVENALATSNVVNDIGLDARGEINTITSFPLFSGAEQIGSGVFLNSIQPAVDVLINKSDRKENENSNLVDAFIIKQDGSLQYASNKELYAELRDKLNNLKDESLQANNRILVWQKN